MELPPEEAKALNDQTDPTWPHAHVRLELLPGVSHRLPLQPHPGDGWRQVRALTYLCEITGITPIVLGDAGQNAWLPCGTPGVDNT